MGALKENEHIDRKGCEFFFSCIGYFNHYAFFTKKLWKKVEGFEDTDEAEVTGFVILVSVCYLCHYEGCPNS